MAAAAYPGNTESLGHSALAQHLHVMRELQDKGVVHDNASQRWFLTEAGWRAATLTRRLSSPSPVFCRGDVALEDATAFELVRLVRDSRWGWRRWLRRPRSTGTWL